MSTRDEIRDAIERYAYARCSEEDGYTISPSIEPVMALIEPHLALADAARAWAAARPKGGVAAVAIGGTVHTVATHEQVRAAAALLAAVDAVRAGGES